MHGGHQTFLEAEGVVDHLKQPKKSSSSSSKQRTTEFGFELAIRVEYTSNIVSFRVAKEKKYFVNNNILVHNVNTYTSEVQYNIAMIVNIIGIIRIVYIMVHIQYNIVQ